MSKYTVASQKDMNRVYNSSEGFFKVGYTKVFKPHRNLEMVIRGSDKKVLYYHYRNNTWLYTDKNRFKQFHKRYSSKLWKTMYS